MLNWSGISFSSSLFSDQIFYGVTNFGADIFMTSYTAATEFDGTFLTRFLGIHSGGVTTAEQFSMNKETRKSTGWSKD